MENIQIRLKSERVRGRIVKFENCSIDIKNVSAKFDV